VIEVVEEGIVNEIENLTDFVSVCPANEVSALGTRGRLSDALGIM